MEVMDTGLSQEVIKEFAKVMVKESEAKKDSFLYGTTKKNGNNIYVKFDGSDLYTPVSSVVDVDDGNRVLVMIKNHSGTVLSNISSPAVSNANFSGFKNEVGEFNLVLTDRLVANEAAIGKLEADYGEFTILITDKFMANEAEIGNLKADYGEFTTLVTDKFTANEAEIGKLKADYGEFTTVVTDKLTAHTASIDIITGDLADYKTVIADELIAAKGWMLEGAIGDAQISNVSANKLAAGTIDTALVTIAGTDGRLQIADNTIQISDSAHVRVQVGKDASGDYTLAVWDADGNLIWDALGATEHTIQRQIIRDSMVADDAAIQALKIDFQSFDTALTEQGVTISGTVVQVGSKTLNVALSEQEQTLIDQQMTLTDHAAKISANESAISLKVDTQVYTLDKATMEASLNKVTSDISVLQDQISLKVTQTDIDAAFAELEVGGRNLLLQSAGFWLDETSYSNVTLEQGKITVTGTGEVDVYKFVNDSLSIDFATLLVPGEWITVSADIRAVGAEDFTLGFNVRTVTHTGITNVDTPIESDAGWKRYSVSYQVQAGDESKVWLYIWIYSDKSNTGAVIEYKNIKVEKGNKGTDWTPAPEDLESEIAAVDSKFINYSTTTQMEAAIELSKDSIISTVSSTYSTKDELSVLETVATQTADKFNWLVESGTSSTDFTLTDRTATLITEYINLNGVVTFSGLDNAAQTLLTTVQDTANAAVEGAAAAQSTADSANTAASSAQATADTANDRATYRYGTCTNAASIVAKAVTLPYFKLYAGATISVRFTYANKAASPTLNVNGTGAKPIYVYGTALTSSSPYNWVAGATVQFVYNGSQWVMTDTSSMRAMANWCYNNNISYIDGGNIYAGTVTAAQINVDDLFAQEITATGSIIGARLVSGSADGERSTEIYQSAIRFYKGDTQTGFIIPGLYKGDTEDEGITFTTNSEYLTLSYYDSANDISMMGYVLNNGLNPGGYTERNIFYETTRFAGKIFVAEGIEIVSSVPYIDFHYNNSAADYTSRIICNGQTLAVMGLPINAMAGVQYSGHGCIYSSADTLSTINYKDTGTTKYIEFGTTSGAFGCSEIWSSDRQLKRNIADSDISGLAVVNAMRHRSFDWADGSGTVAMGYIAQELQEIEPGLVFAVPQEEYGELLQISSSRLIPYITKAVQELSDGQELCAGEIESLMDRLNDAFIRIAELDAEIAQLRAMLASA